MPDDMIRNIVQRWNSAGHGKTLDAKKFLHQLVMLKKQEDAFDEIWFKEGMDVYIVNTSDVFYGAKGRVANQKPACRELGKIFVVVGEDQPVLARKIAVKKSHVLREEPKFYDAWRAPALNGRTRSDM